MPLNKDEALEVVLYIGSKLVEKGVEPTVELIFQMLYLADKLHLQRYGRMILEGEHYTAYAPQF